MQFYDPNTLLAEVQELLAARGLDAEITDSVTAQTGAAMLLRGLGVTPAIDAVDAYARNDAAGPWADADDRRAG
jgi:hypothetical protein